MTDVQQQSQSCIKTSCTIDKKEVLKWILTRFPELNIDAKLEHTADNYQGAIVFTVEHTTQPPKKVGPILLDDPNGDVADAEFKAF